MRPTKLIFTGILVLLTGCGEDTAITTPEVEPPPEPQPECEISLQVGQTAEPASAGSRCRLSAQAGAEYALAVLDGRSIESASNGLETSFSPYTVTVALGLDAPPLIVSSAAGSVAPEPVEFDQVSLPASATHSNSPHQRAEPWVLDEQFSLYEPLRRETLPARVVRVYPGGLVAAWIEGDAPDQLTEFLRQLDFAVETVREHALPMLRTTFVPGMPVTSTASGQYLIVLGSDSGARGRAWSISDGDSVFTWMSLSVDIRAGEVSLASLVAHEMTHSFQRMYMHASRPAGVPDSYTGSTLWGVEGGANLISYEMVRRVAGIELGENFDWRNPPPTPFGQFYALRAQPGFGEFTAGYDNTMGFLRDLLIRRVRAGETVAEAVREVSRGALEGWYGYDHLGRRPGLTERMQARLGESWEPVAAMLDWTISHAADDLTTNSAAQDHAVLRAWDIPEEQVVGWRPAGVLSESGRRRWTVTRRGGSPHYFYLRDDGDGIGFSVSSEISELHWKLIRTR